MTRCMIKIKTSCFPWSERDVDGYHILSVGSRRTVTSFCEALPSDRRLTVEDIAIALNKASGAFSFIVEGPLDIFAVCDRIRCYPLFYSVRDGGVGLSDSAEALRDGFSLTRISPASLLELKMSGYVQGAHTLYEDLNQVRAGELVHFDKQKRKLKKSRYYSFYSNSLFDASFEDLLEELEVITDRMFDRAIESAGGRPIIVPLSGGLDSRLVLCKLHEKHYPELSCFSYGPASNYEAKAAKKVAEAVGVPWRFVNCPMNESRDYFHSQQRREYFRFAGGLSAVPGYGDLFPLATMLDRGLIPDHALIVNGQAGDFTTGGHIPGSLLSGKCGLREIFEAVVDKNFSLWTDLLTEENLDSVKERFELEVAEGGRTEDGNYASARLHEYWEWQERQAKFVANGQRIYDFLGIDWMLPLWEEEYKFFWPRVPVPYKAGQKLYKAYLDRYDYRGVFKTFDPPTWRWPGVSITFVGLARVVGLLAGRKRKEDFYSYAKYFGHYRNQYGVYPYLEFLKHARHHRNPISFFVNTYLDENIFVNEQ